MDKDGIYFPHWTSARNDRKIKRLRKELGVEGYGIFFMLLEVLREQTDHRYPMEDLDLLAEEFGTSEQKVRVVVANYKLFDVDEEENFFSPKLIIFLEPFYKKREQRRNAIKSRWAKEKQKKLEGQKDTTVIRPYNDRTTDVIQSKVKESKGKESKGKEVEEVTADSLLPIDSLKTSYLENETVVNAVINNPKNKIPNREFLEKRLEEFNNFRAETGRTVDTAREYASHFRNWNQKAPVDDQPTADNQIDWVSHQKFVDEQMREAEKKKQQKNRR